MKATQPQRIRRRQSTLYTARHRSRLIYSAFLFLGVLVIGTLGYHVLEGWSWLDSLYMTVITMGTVGYGETQLKNTGNPEAPENRRVQVVNMQKTAGK